jgi:hypothetical protein
MWLTIGLGIYGFGFFGTLAYNLRDIVYISSPLVVCRNAIFWPVFLPILIALKGR